MWPIEDIVRDLHEYYWVNVELTKEQQEYLKLMHGVTQGFPNGGIDTYTMGNLKRKGYRIKYPKL